MLYLFGGSLWGISILTIVNFGISSFSTHQFTSLDFNLPSQFLQKASNTKRVQKLQNLLTTRYRTSSPNFLGNHPFGGTNIYGRWVSPQRSLTITEASAYVEKFMPSSDFETETHKIKVNGRIYNIHLFTYDGKKYWHPYGNVVTYKDGQADVKKLDAIVKKDFSGYELPPGFDIELDHAIPVTFSNAMRITRDEAAVVLVPGFANAVRTNTKELVDDFSNFDWRLSEVEQLTTIEHGLELLIKNRLTDSIYRNLTLYLDNTEHVIKIQRETPELDLDIYKNIYHQIASGYSEAYLSTMQYYKGVFCDKFNIRYNDQSSIFAFYNELLIEGMKRDFEKAKRYSSDYFNPLGKNGEKLIPEYFVSEILKNFTNQYKLSKQIQSFIPSAKYKEETKHFLDLQFHSYENLIYDLIENCKQSKNSKQSPELSSINTAFVQNKLAEFKLQLNEKDEDISTDELFKKIFTPTSIIVLGDFYTKPNFGTGQSLELFIYVAKQKLPVISTKKNVFYLQRIKNKETLMQPTQTPYQAKMAEKIQQSVDTRSSSKSKDSQNSDEELESWLPDIFFPSLSGGESGDNPGDGGGGNDNPGDGGGGDDNPGGGSGGDDNPGGGSGGDDNPGGSRSKSVDGDEGGVSKGKNPKRYGPPTIPQSAWKIPAYKK